MAQHIRGNEAEGNMVSGEALLGQERHTLSLQTEEETKTVEKWEMKLWRSGWGNEALEKWVGEHSG